VGARLGQHFLRDDRILRRILDAAQLAPHHRVLEVGPGAGALTQPLAAAVPDGKVVAVEADAELARAMQGRFANVDVVHRDVLKTNLERLGPFDRIVSNLPYQVSGPVTVAFLDLLARQGWGKAVLMYQKEFAERLLAGPGSKRYGRLSVHVARWCRTQVVTEVSPASFSPPPAVRSMVIALTPHPTPPFVVADEALWRRVIDAAFAERRKMLHNTVGRLDGAAEALTQLGLADLRPEQVAPADFARIVAALVQA